MRIRMAVFVKIASAIFVFAMELTSVPKKSPQTSCLSGLFVCFSFCLFVFLYLCITRLLPCSWQWLEGATQMVSAAGRGCSTSQSRRPQMIQKQKQYFPRLQKYIFSWGEKHCPPPNYWVIGPQHRFHCKTTKDGNH